ncbi:MAG: hypothetical protein IT184_08325 [Acidobacteria bacterium]|nr:hypothetical protein [Acidobacteriota bacterium]
MKAAILLSGLLWTHLAPSRADAQVIDRYLETVDVDRQGDASVTVTLEVAGGAGGLSVRIPAAGRRPGPVSVTGDARLSVSVVTDGPAWIVVEGGDEVVRPVTIGLRYRTAGIVDFGGPALAHGNRRLSYRFVNTHDAIMRRVERTVVLPEPQIVSSVDDVVPAAGETSVSVPYALETRGGRAAVTIGTAELAVGAELGATVVFRSRPSWLPLLLVLAAAAAAYLYAFRDLARPGRLTPERP